MRRLGLVLLVPLSLFAQQLVFEFKFDSTQYEKPDVGYFAYSIVVIQSPDIYNSGNIGTGGRNTTTWTGALKRKNSDQYDIFSLQGKIGSVIIPTSITPRNCARGTVYVSQTILDNDLGWEYIAFFTDTTNYESTINTFKVIDDNGVMMLSDSGTAYYGYDGINTYVVSSIGGGIPSKIWKFRSNVSAQAPLAKSAAAGIQPMMALMPSGDFHVSLQPAAGGTSVQIFDMMGRQVFNKTIQNINKPTSFNIPSSKLPNCPFISQVSNSNGTFAKKSIPVR